jgi:hypothetical protein
MDWYRKHDVNPHAEQPRSIRNPTFHPVTIPTPPDESDTTGQVFFEIRMIPTPPDQSDHMHASFNPKVPGSRPGRPTSSTNDFRKFSRIRTE